METGLFFLLSLMHASIGMPVWMQRSGANLLAAVAAGEEALSEARSLSDTDGIKLSESILMALRADIPYRHKPEQ